MKQRFTKLLAAVALLVFMMPSLVAWGQQEVTLWSEDFSSYSANEVPTGGIYSYACTNGTGTSGAGTTKIYNENTGGGTAPELLIGKPGTGSGAVGGSFTAVIPLDNIEGTLTLTYYQNKQKLSVSSTTTGVLGGQDIKPADVGQQTITFTGITTSMNSITIVFQATTNNNVRLDNIVLKGTQAGGTPTPSMSVSTNSIDFGSNPINPSEPYTQTFDVTFANLTQNLTISGFSGVTVSPATISANATSPQTVTVTYNPTTEGSISGNISVNSSEVNEQLVAVTGSAYDPANIPSYSLVTNVNQLHAGDVIILGCYSKGAVAGAMGTNSYFVKKDAVFNNSTVTTNDAIQITLGGGTESWTLTTSEGQICASSQNLNHAGTGTTTWTISVLNGVAHINAGSSNGDIQYNASSPRFKTYTSSQTSIEIYKLVNTNQVAKPTFAPPAGTYYEAQSVTINCATNGASIYYTTNGDDPTTSSSLYSGAITVSQNTTIKAFAVKEGMDDSEIAVAEYVFPVMNSYTLVNSIESGRRYIIVNQDKGKAMGAQNGSIRSAVDVTLNTTTNKATVSSDVVYEFVINGPDGQGRYTIYDAKNSKYLYASSSSSNDIGIREFNKGEANGLWQITLDENDNAATIIAQGSNSRNNLMYNYNNGNNDRFTCYGSNTSLTTTPIYLYVKDGETENTYITDITGYGDSKYGYTLIACPIDGVNPANVTGMTDGNYDLYRFNQDATLEWENYKNHTSDFVLERGKGYLYAHKTDVTLAFAGTPVEGTSYEVTLHKTTGAEFEGVNLVGNPFGQRAYITGPFYVMKADGSDFELAPNNRNYVEPMEGIIVGTDSDGETLVFSTIDPNSKTSGLSINLTRGQVNVIDRAIVSFGEGRQLPKFQLRENSTKVYFTEGNQDFAVVRSHETQGEMPVNFKAEENGTYTLSINTENVEMNYLHLIDNMTGMDVDLLQTPSYTFDATTNDYTSRFRLVFSANDVNEQNAETFAFFSNGNWVIGNEGEATLQVIDVNGRIVSNETINGTVATSIVATPGVYMLRLVNGNEVKTQKIVVR